MAESCNLYQWRHHLGHIKLCSLYTRNFDSVTKSHQTPIAKSTLQCQRNEGGDRVGWKFPGHLYKREGGGGGVEREEGGGGRTQEYS